MRMRETLINGDPELYEQRYSLATFGRFVRRPASIVPPDRTVCFVDEGPREGVIDRYDGALFLDGEWRRTRFKPTHWTVPE